MFYNGFISRHIAHGVSASLGFETGYWEHPNRGVSGVVGWAFTSGLFSWEGEGRVVWHGDRGLGGLLLGLAPRLRLAWAMRRGDVFSPSSGPVKCEGILWPGSKAAAKSASRPRLSSTKVDQGSGVHAGPAFREREREDRGPARLCEERAVSYKSYNSISASTSFGGVLSQYPFHISATFWPVKPRHVLGPPGLGLLVSYHRWAGGHG